ncbi:MAG: hypothetical protein H7096_14660 [Flavobacterium sp.]|nr:hypothetical protein [Pedobacter sp.]
MNQSSGNYTSLIKKIDEFIRKYYLNKIIRGSIYLSASFFVAYLLITFAEYFGHFNPAIRTILFYTFLLLNLLILLKYIFVPVLSYFKLGKSINNEQACNIIGEHFESVKDKLLNTLQLKRQVDEDKQYQSLIEASINQRILELKPLPFTGAVRIEENKKYLKYPLIPLLAIILIFLTAPSIFSESTERLLKHNTAFIKKAPFTFLVLNNNLEAIQGNDYKLSVKLIGNEIPLEVYVEDGLNIFKLEKQSTVNFSYVFKNLQTNKKIRIKAGDYSSNTYEIVVKKKPALLRFSVRLEYPLYLHKINETKENTGDLTIPTGTRLTWRFETENTDKIHVDFNSNNKITNLSHKKDFSFSYRALKNTTYSVRAVNNELQSADSISYQLNVIPDLYPSIQINEKADSLNSRKLYFIGQVNDDHGFKLLRFNYRVLNSQKINLITKAITIDKTSLQNTFFYTWDVSKLNEKPGEQIEYYFEILDNDDVNGPKASRSTIKTFTLLTEKQIDQKLASNSSSIKENINQAIKQAAQLEQETKRLNQQLLNQKNLSYDDKKQLEKLLGKQKELEGMVKNIQSENKKNLIEQQENKEIRQNIFEKQKQIEDLFNNVLDEKTREILKNLEKLLEQNNKNQTQDELSKMQIDNKSLKKELNRILELYKQLDFEQNVIKTAQKLKKLSVDQRVLSEKTSQKNADLNVLKQKQEELKKEFKTLQENLKELSARNNELEQKNDFHDQKAEQQEIAAQQELSTKNLNNKSLKKASENQKQAAQKIQQLSEKLESFQQESEEAENNINIQNLREILDNLIKTSFEEETIMDALKNTNTSDPKYIIGTQKQKDIKDNLKMMEDSLYSLSKKVPQIQAVVNKEIQAVNFHINSAIDNLSERKTPEANRDQQYAMTSINNLALMLSDALDQMQKAQTKSKSGGKGKKQNLSQLSKMQDQLNKNMQKAKDQMQREGLEGMPKPGKGKWSEQLATMAREQQMIRQRMQEINQELNKDGESGLGNLNKVMKEMEQTETDLVNKKIYRETINRQQEILTRLLEAEKAEREREQDNQRESKQGVDQPSHLNNHMIEFETIKQKETELLKTVPPSLNSFYKIKVGDYFKFLNWGNNGN